MSELMNVIFQIVMVAVAAVWFAELSMIPQWFTRRLGRKRIKPFDCPLCLAWWSGLVWFAATGNGPAALAYAACASALAVWASKRVND
jgi:hypothetical protein